ncbi:Putative N-hydroxyarylamine O-acetyltransferase [Escherichia coli]|nr:Putative N-hydroxyarylamine O-acetyltransferase [Escherichia coli]
MTPILNHYFARINWSGAAAVNIDTLRALHLKHNCTIPFENLDVLLPREIQLSIAGRETGDSPSWRLLF